MAATHRRTSVHKPHHPSTAKDRHATPDLHSRRTGRFRWMILCLFVFLCGAVRANDGSYFTTGNQLLPLVESDIRVQREILTLSWGDDGTADVDVYYEFFNPGAQKTLLMGFEADPPSYMDSLDRSGAHPNISDFTVVMNGRPLAVATSVVRSDTLYLDKGHVRGLDLNEFEVDESNAGDWIWSPRLNDGVPISFVYHFEATFKPGVNVVRHRYRYDMEEMNYRYYDLSYKLTPASRWAGRQIDDFTLRIKTRDVPLHFFMEDSLFAQPLYPHIYGTGNSRRRTMKTSGYPEQGSVSVYEIFLRNSTAEFKAKNYRPGNELEIFSADGTETGNIDHASDYYAHRHHVSLSHDFFETPLTQEQYRRIRNLPFALRGYVFKDKGLDRYFRERWWYIPDPAYQATLDSLTPEERKWLREFDKKYGTPGRR